jgi:hypothetical protein
VESAVHYLASDVIDAGNARIDTRTTATVTAGRSAKGHSFAQECGAQRDANLLGAAVPRARF